MAVKKITVLPYHRRGSVSSEDDFFDIAEEPCLAMVKRQLRRFRTWVMLALFSLLIFLHHRHSSTSPALSPIQYDRIDWSRFAYSQYATSTAYLCNAVMVLDSLQRVGSRAERVLFYPDGWGVGSKESTDRDSQLLALARDKYNALLVAVDDKVIRGGIGADQSWNTSIAKFLAFGQTQYDRVIHLDSDSVVLGNMDELFFLPAAKVAMARAYDMLPESKELASHLIVVEPSHKDYSALMDAAKSAMSEETNPDNSTRRYDMELLNRRYADSALVLPHRLYGLVTGEFRSTDHKSFLGAEDEAWDPDKALAEAKFVHFSDWPLPKPWIMWPRSLLAEMIPKCNNKPGVCRDRDIWKGLYEDFRKKRKVCLCRVPADIMSNITN